MIINNPDALKGWLTVILEPLCDADPSALTRYVFALLKKEKPVKEFKKSMTEQLDVFLGVETKPFLERLFTAIASEEYLNQSTIKPEVEIISERNIEPIHTKNEKECTPPIIDTKTKELLEKMEENGTPSLEQVKFQRLLSYRL